MMDWHEPDFRRFFEQVERLWPSYNVTRESIKGLWYKRFRSYSTEEVERTLTAHRDDYPDATKPTWKLVVADLGLLSQGEANEFTLHIAQLRKHGRDSERSDRYPYGRGLHDKSDAEVWVHWLRANSPRYKISPGEGEEPCTNAVCVAAGGCGLTRRMCVGQHWEQTETAYWVEYLTNKGFEVPDYLAEPGYVGGPDRSEDATGHAGDLFGARLDG